MSWKDTVASRIQCLDCDVLVEAALADVLLIAFGMRTLVTARRQQLPRYMETRSFLAEDLDDDKN